MLPRKNAFTLIELLIVIAIISILVSMSAPALIAARGRAYSAKCKNNLKNINLWIHLYSDNWSHRFPEEDGGRFLRTLYFASNTADSQSFLCPGTLDDNRNGELLIEEPDGRGTSYGARYNDPLSSWYLSGRQQRESSKTTIVSDRMLNNHADSMNFLFLDGHVDQINAHDMKLDWYLAPLSSTR